MTVVSYQKNHYYNQRHEPQMPALEPTTAKYLLDFLHFTREDEQFRFYRKVSVAECFELLNDSRVVDRLPQFI
jgi:hypothetical protein